MSSLFSRILRYRQRCTNHKFRKPGRTFFALKSARDFTFQRYPRELRGPGDGSKAENETAGNRRGQQGFRGPFVSGTAKFCWRCGRYRVKSIAREADFSVGPCSSSDLIVMRIILHRDFYLAS